MSKKLFVTISSFLLFPIFVNAASQSNSDEVNWGKIIGSMIVIGIIIIALVVEKEKKKDNSKRSKWFKDIKLSKKSKQDD